MEAPPWHTSAPVMFIKVQSDIRPSPPQYTRCGGELRQGTTAAIYALRRLRAGCGELCLSALLARPLQRTVWTGVQAVGAGTRATLGIVRGGTVSVANGGVERSETVPGPELPWTRDGTGGEAGKVSRG